jgi:hypothetical protein
MEIDELGRIWKKSTVAFFTGLGRNHGKLHA